MKEGCYLVLDVGTTSVKVSVMDRNFCVKYTSIREYQLEASGSQVELEPEVYTRSAAEGIREAVRAGQVIGLRGIAVTTQGETLIPVDRDGVPLSKAIVWLDGRAEDQAKEIQAKIPEDLFYEKTGIPGCNGLCPVSKLLWIREQKPEVYEQAKYFLLLEDYLIFWLTGRFATEKSLLCTTGYFDIQKDELWEEILDRFSIEKEKIPPVYECGTVVGNVLPVRAEELGLSGNADSGQEGGIPVVTAAMDQICSALGAGNCFSGMVTETTGTAMCIGETVERYQLLEKARIPVYRHGVPGKYMLLAVCMTAGMTLKWFKDVFCRSEQEEAEKNGVSVYEILDQMAESAEPLCGGLRMLPYLSGSVQPFDAPGLEGSIHGISLRHTKADFVRSIMEGVGFMLRENLELLECITGEKIDKISSMGGGAKGDCWCQIKADISGAVIQAGGQPETTSAGAAVLCAVGIGDYPSVEEAAQDAGMAGHQENGDRVFCPDDTLTELYAQAYREYKAYLEQEVKLSQSLSSAGEE